MEMPFQSLTIQSMVLLTLLFSATHLVYGFTFLTSTDPFYRDFRYKTNYVFPYDDVGMPDELGNILPPKADPIDVSRISVCFITSPRDARKPNIEAYLKMISDKVQDTGKNAYDAFDEANEEKTFYSVDVQDQEETFYTKRKEVHFQVSFKIPLFNIKRTQTRFYAAYTQNSCWQAHTKKHAFFRENNYNPEFFIEQDFTIKPGLGPQIQKVKVGLIHQSNGRGMKPGPGFQKSYERSWNRLYAAINLQWGPYCTITLEPWRVLSTKDLRKYNKEIVQHLGYGQITFNVKNNYFNFELQKRLKSLQVIAVFPITPSLNCVARYFNGYGSTVGMYNKPAHSLGIGMGLRD